MFGSKFIYKFYVFTTNIVIWWNISAFISNFKVDNSNIFPTNEPVEQFSKEQGQGRHHKVPGPGRVQDEENEVSRIEEVSEVEDLKVAAVPHEGHGADHHDGQDDNQSNSGRVGNAHNKSEQSLMDSLGKWQIYQIIYWYLFLCALKSNPKWKDEILDCS